jgi:hypothetical protein
MLLDTADLPAQIVTAVEAFAQRLATHVRAQRDAALDVHEQGVVEALKQPRSLAEWYRRDH